MSDRGAGRTALRVLAFAVAALTWWIVSAEKRESISEKVVDASVSYNAPRGIMLLDPVQSVKVRLRGPDRQIRALAPYALDVVVDVDAEAPGAVAIQLTQENVLAPQGVEVVTVEPNWLDLRIDEEASSELPVVVPLVGEPAGGAIAGTARVRPDRARVLGPASLVSGMTSVSTSPVSLEGHALDFTQTVSVVAADPLVRVVEPRFVTVFVPMSVPEAPAEAAEEEPAARRGRPR